MREGPSMYAETLKDLSILSRVPLVDGTLSASSAKQASVPDEAATRHGILLRDNLAELMERERQATSGLHQLLSESTGFDTSLLWERTTRLKRVLYLSVPAIVPDPLPTSASYRRTGTNGRVALLRASPVEESIRFEAICTFAMGAVIARYALAIQYLLDHQGGFWQVLRPVLLVDPRVMGTISNNCERDCAPLSLLATLISQCNHDYLHGTMMRWFPPPSIDCDKPYRQLMSERSAPHELQQWEAETDANRSGPMHHGRRVLVSDALEFWSLIVHARLFRTQPNRGIFVVYRDLLMQLEDLCNAYPSVSHQLQLLAGIASFFISLLSPSQVEKAGGALSASSAGYARRVHGGLGYRVAAMDSDTFLWADCSVPLFRVLERYRDHLESAWQANKSSSDTPVTSEAEVVYARHL